MLLIERDKEGQQQSFQDLVQDVHRSSPPSGYSQIRYCSHAGRPWRVYSAGGVSMMVR
jgi:hypothetical protein